VSRRPRLVFSHDTRHFSREFAEFCSKVGVELGCDVFLYEEDRSTPALSFAVRQLGADGGVMLTASHNPPHDNGYKAIFDDGGQLIEPHASAVIAKVAEIPSDRYDALPEEQRGQLTPIGKKIDDAYLHRLQALLLRPELLTQVQPPKIVFTNLHGTGARMIPRVLEKLGFPFVTVAEQDEPDGRFPTVASPNPENAAALAMALELADKEQAEIVIATDPDCDRMGTAVRNEKGDMVLLSGNQIGSLLAYYRIKTFFDQGILTDTNRERSCLIKTYVTTELQKAIADHYGVQCINTLTGFKYIAAKLRKYEQAIPRHLYRDYHMLSEEESRALRLEHSKFFIFGGEESYGYLGHDAVRDKDANGAALMFAELAAYAASTGRTIAALLDDIYKQFGYFEEQNHSLVFEGAEGAARIAKLADSYASSPPTEVDGSEVLSLRDFANQDIYDEEGDLQPKEKMLIVDLADGRSFAVRPSGTEPKIKFYLFGRALPQPGRSLSAEALADAKQSVSDKLATLWKWLEEDANQRA